MRLIYLFLDQAHYVGIETVQTQNYNFATY